MQEEIVSSRGKTLWLAFGSAAFVSIAIWLLNDDPEEVTWIYATLLFFGLCLIVAARSLFRPMKLRLDKKGFTLSGGMMRGERRHLWADVEPFTVIRVSLTSEMVAYNFKPHARNETFAMKLSRRVGADAGLPMGWPGKPQDLADKLNAFRSRALDESPGAIQT